ncbi:hypothetical protein [Methylobacterium sp. J-068]|uniref:hypothetical protein n=1 Tax=Methylobacterium sp. J-068 TaxID=2836649 RepID=UPI001FBAE237|nr:hypothetical protein [Methylobacterium sp. J-068]MCJ2032622.1 hypothetical protein [Methylobacterium sp. J-068]
MKEFFFNFNFGRARIPESNETINLKAEAEIALTEFKMVTIELDHAQNLYKSTDQKWKRARAKLRAANKLVRTSHFADFQAKRTQEVSTTDSIEGAR